MNTPHSALGRAMLVLFLCASATACPSGDKSTGPVDPGPDSIPSTVQDRTPPTIQLTRPARGVTNVDVSTVIEVEFSEPMDIGSVTAQSLKIDGVPGVVTLNGDRATFTPNAALGHGARYVARVTTQARDTAGNAMAQEYSWDFTTGAAPPVFAPLPLSAGKVWHYLIGDTARVCTRSGCSESKSRGVLFVHVEEEVPWEGRTAWRIGVYRFPLDGPSQTMTVRTEHVAQTASGLLRWKNGAWRTVLPATGNSFPSAAFFLIDGPTHNGTSTRISSSATVGAGTFATTMVKHEFTETGPYATDDIFETRVEHYAQDVGLVLGEWSYTKDDNDPAGIDEARRGRIALLPPSPFAPTFTEEQEPNDAHLSANTIPGELNILSGATHIGHSGATIRDADVGCVQECIHADVNGQKRLQDWYQISVPRDQTVSFQLVFEPSFTGAPRANDLDLYLFRLTPSGIRFVESSANEPGEAEALTTSLSEGRYFLAVQAWDTPTSEVPYWLLSSVITRSNVDAK